ncbi:Synerg-CTERM sorting domain-containing protein [Cloacibacillus evryensis]|uniref:Synerg-CTERM sorting domain-containing protein n=1 Tax=Cloacibacillus evryensis TaxID=508460 RepID=UPI003AB166FB
MSKKKFFAALMVLAMALTMSLAGAASATDVWEGDVGTVPSADVNNVITITTGAQLAGLASAVNSGTTYAGYTVRLDDDIDLDENPWTPIGYFIAYWATNRPFKGTFDGAGHSITNLKVAITNTAYGQTAALFGYIDYVESASSISAASVLSASQKSAAVANVKAAALSEAQARGLTGAAATKFAEERAAVVETFGADASASALRAATTTVSGGTVKNLKVYGIVTNSAGQGAAGIVCWNDGCVKDCYFSGTASISNSSNRAYVGGICSLIGEYASIENCVASVNSTAMGSASYAGGILGFCYVATSSPDIFDAYGSVANCSVESGSAINSAMDAGGIVGGFAYKIYNCSSAATSVLVNGGTSGAYRGGIVGGYGTGTKCYWLTGGAGQPAYLVGGGTDTTGAVTAIASLPYASVHFDPLTVAQGSSAGITIHNYPTGAGVNVPALSGWQSADTAIATVSNGTVTGVTVGETVVTVSSVTSSSWLSEQILVNPECRVKVTPASSRMAAASASSGSGPDSSSGGCMAGFGALALLALVPLALRGKK